jgi:hypothetical protein
VKRQNKGEWKPSRGKKARPRCKHFHNQYNWCKSFLKNHDNGNDKQPYKGIVPSAFPVSELGSSSSQATKAANLLPPVLPSGSKRKRAPVARLTQSQEDETRVRRKMELRERRQTSSVSGSSRGGDFVE